MTVVQGRRSIRGARALGGHTALDSETAPSTYRERMMNRLLVRRALDAVNREYALDVLVYTRPEWQRKSFPAKSLWKRQVTGDK